jgi:hypothetical protein
MIRTIHHHERRHVMRRRNFLLTAGGTALAGTALAGATPAAAAPANTSPRAAQDAMLAAFDKHPIVGGLSPSHGVRNVDEFLISLICHPRLPDVVTDIVAENGNSLYQPLVDEYIAGGDVPLAAVRQAWRNDLLAEGAYSTFYEQVYPLVRRINQRLPHAKKLRVLAAEPPIDWSTITGPADFFSIYDDRDQHIASVLEHEVLSKQRKALILMGTGHLRHGTGAAAIYEQTYPNATFVITAHLGFAKDNNELERRMASWPVPSLATFEGSWLGQLDSSYFSLPGDAPLDPGKGYPGIDGYLYLGPRDFLMHQPLSARAILDNDLTAELDRRATLVQVPPDAPWWPSVLFQQEAASSVFLYDPDRQSL